ncbi:uncharacterized protein LOC126749530 isoform X2 [Anthonomus grandis grandis]|uniref:uncharacterized protein LOC126749530 isoform X2 n=1 Tax=Anthonomus grandis grandis TaxID=2921223 RepID=UPI002165AF9B|nr:uncharacterized protein LOC126749530 isoform X2 [Anthonomus grandis grandis]
MKRKAKEDLKRKAKKRLLEDLRRKMEKFERFMETSTSRRAIRFGNVLPWLQGGYQGILYEERPTRRLHIHHVSFDK